MVYRLDDMIAEGERQRDEVCGWLAALDDARFAHRPAVDRWSVGEHIAHVTLTDRPYFPPIREALDGERASGRSAEGPFKGGMLGNWFARMLEPPPRRRLRTTKKLEPPRELDREEVSADFVACRDELLALMRAAEGLDMDRARLRSPFLALLKMPVSSAFAVLLAHGRRHIWIAREGLTG